MESLNVMTKFGRIALDPGDKFQSTNNKRQISLYQFLGVVEDIGEKNVYLHDETSERFVEVSLGWFSNRSVRRIGGNENEL